MVVGHESDYTPSDVGDRGYRNPGGLITPGLKGVYPTHDPRPSFSWVMSRIGALVDGGDRIMGNKSLRFGIRRDLQGK